MRTRNLCIILILGGLLFAAIPAPTVSAAIIIRVTTAGATSGTCGSTWAAPCSLQHALTDAASGDEIWVKEGTYTPGVGRHDAFTLKTGAAVHGGFAGTETARTQRNWATHETILSGDLIGVHSYHVVVSPGVGNTAKLDGFTVTGGSADGPGVAGQGGGMFNLFGGPTVGNVIFHGNSAVDGGGMYNIDSNPALTNVTFSGNSAVTGGGMYNDRNTTGSDPALTNVTFSGNTAGDLGGGMYNVDSDPALTNVTFSGNTAVNHGGGMYNGNTLASSPMIRNAIFWGNTPDQITIQAGSSGTVSYSVVQGGCPANGTCDHVITADPLLGALGNYGGRATQTIPLLPGSSAIDAGNGAYCPATDQRGVARVGACDRGAFESQKFLLTITGGNNQHALPGTAFAAPLSVGISSAHGEPVNGGRITFTAPASGASATLVSSPVSVAGGAASVNATANSTLGSYHVTASAAGANSVSFSLLNGVMAYLPVIVK